MTGNEKRKGLFAQVTLLISSLTGVGFSSGHEIWSFFVRHGYGGIIAIIVMPFVLAAFIYMTLLIYSNKKAQEEYEEKCSNNRSLLILTNIIDTIIALFIGIVVISMISASGDVLNQLTGIPVYIGCLISSAVVIAAVAGGSIKYVTKYLSVALPVILISTIIICLIFLSLSSGKLIIPKTESGVPFNWLISLMFYVSYNMLVICGVASSMGNHVNGKKNALLAASLSVAAFGSIAILQFFVESKIENIGAINGFQMVYAAQKISPVLATIYRILILISAIGTAIACFYAFISKIIRIKYFSGIKQKKLIIIVSVFCCVGSLLGFANIVSSVYPVLGAVGMISLAIIIYRYYIISKSA